MGTCPGHAGRRQGDACRVLGLWTAQEQGRIASFAHHLDTCGVDVKAKVAGMEAGGVGVLLRRSQLFRGDSLSSIHYFSQASSSSSITQKFS